VFDAGNGGQHRIISAAFYPIMIVGGLRLFVVMEGTMEASAMRMPGRRSPTLPGPRPRNRTDRHYDQAQRTAAPQMVHGVERFPLSRREADVCVLTILG